jgi:hypothetical protein
MLTTAVAYADVTDTVDATLTATESVSLTVITHDPRTIVDHSLGDGATAIPLSDPIQIDVEDTFLESTGAMLKVRISSALPAHYGTEAGDLYFLSTSMPTLDTYYDDCDLGLDDGAAYAISALTDSDQTLAEVLTADAEHRIVHKKMGFQVNLIVNNNKRLYGSTADSHTLTFTAVDL